MQRMMMLSARILVFAAFLVFMSCGERKSEIAANPTIAAIFSDSEIRDLTVILDFFETQICDLMQVHPDSIKDCYQAFFNNVAVAQSTGVIYVPVPFDKQKEMYNSLSETAFTEIWLRGMAVDQETGDTTVRMNLSFNGKYMRFLEALKADYQILEAYRSSLAEQKMIANKGIETVLYNYHLYNMDDIRMRLFIALHYLTLNDVYVRKNE